MGCLRNQDRENALRSASRVRGLSDEQRQEHQPFTSANSSLEATARSSVRTALVLGVMDGATA